MSTAILIVIRVAQKKTLLFLLLQIKKRNLNNGTINLYTMHNANQAIIYIN